MNLSVCLYKIHRESMNKQERGNLDIIYFIEYISKSESVIRSTELLHKDSMRTYWLDQQNALKIFPIMYL